MAKTKAQIQFEAETSGFNSEIKAMDSSLTTLRKELKLNGAELKGNADDVDLLSKRKQILKQEADATEKKIQALNSKLEIAQRQFGESSREATVLSNKIIDTKTAFQTIQNEISQTDGKLDTLDSGLNKVEKGFKEADNASDSAGDGFTVMKGVVADLAANAISSAVSAIGDFLGSLWDLSEATEEYRTMQAKLEGSANTFGYSTEFASEKYKEFNKYLGDDQMATNAITNLMGLGTSTESLTALSNAAIGVWSAYGDSIPIESLTESMNETAQVGKVTGNLADALNWAGVSEDKFNEKLGKCKTTQERANLIAKTLNGTYGESKNTYDELNKSVLDANEAQTELSDTQATLGEAISPLTTAFTMLKNNALEAIAPVVENVSSALSGMVTWLQEHPTVLKAAAAAVSVLAIGLGGLAIAVGVYTVAQWAMNSAILANPIVWVAAAIIAAIAGIVAIVVVIISKWNEIKEATAKVWGNIKKSISEAINAVKTTVSNVVNNIKAKVTSVWNGIKNVTSTVFNGVKNVVSNVWNGIKNTISSVVTGVKTKVSNIWNGIKNTTSAVFTNIKSKVSNIWESIKTTISEKIEGAKEKVKKVIDKIKGFFNFKFKWPDLKMPHFTISPDGWKIGDLLKGVKPKLAIDWYAEGGVFTRPTILNSSNGLKGVGEAGTEAILPVSVLQDYINRAFARNINAYATESGGGNVYNLYLDNATINSNEEMEAAARKVIIGLVRLGGMNK